MAKTKVRGQGNCDECGKPMYYEVEQIPNGINPPKTRREGPTCGSGSGCTLDLKRRQSPDYVKVT